MPSLTAVPHHAPSGKRSHRDQALDGLRGVAILLVFLFHYGGGLRAHNPLIRSFGLLTQGGWVGVELFFALSGYLISGILGRALFPSPAPPSPGLPWSAQPRASARGSRAAAQAPTLTTSKRTPPPTTTGRLHGFYQRRARRILPVYLAALLACAVAALLSGAHLAQLKPLLIYAAFLQNLPPFTAAALLTPPPLPLFHLWSLAVEEQFYLLWPLVLLAARTPRRALHFSIGVFAASCFFRGIVFHPGLLAWPAATSLATLLPTRAGALALGSALAFYQAMLPRPGEADVAPNQRDDPSPIEEAIQLVPSNGRRAGHDTRQSLLPPPGRDRQLGASALTRLALLLSSAAALVVIALAVNTTHSLLLNSRSAFVVLLPAADVLSFCLVALALTSRPVRAFLRIRPLPALGRISYGFYVLHILLEPLFDRLGVLLTHTHTGFPYQTARLLTAFPLTVLAAWLSFTYFERPFLRRKHPLVTSPSD